MSCFGLTHAPVATAARAAATGLVIVRCHRLGPGSSWCVGFNLEMGYYKSVANY